MRDTDTGVLYYRPFVTYKPHTIAYQEAENEDGTKLQMDLKPDWKRRKKAVLIHTNEWLGIFQMRFTYNFQRFCLISTAKQFCAWGEVAWQAYTGIECLCVSAFVFKNWKLELYFQKRSGQGLAC